MATQMANKYDSKYIEKVNNLIDSEILNPTINNYIHIAFNILIEYNKISFFDNFTPDNGYMFCKDNNINEIENILDIECNREHSGSSMAYVLRNLKYIMDKMKLNFITKYDAEFITMVTDKINSKYQCKYTSEMLLCGFNKLIEHMQYNPTIDYIDYLQKYQLQTSYSSITIYPNVNKRVSESLLKIIDDSYGHSGASLFETVYKLQNILQEI